MDVVLALRIKGLIVVVLRNNGQGCDYNSGSMVVAVSYLGKSRTVKITNSGRSVCVVGWHVGKTVTSRADDEREGKKKQNNYNCTMLSRRFTRDGMLRRRRREREKKAG